LSVSWDDPRSVKFAAIFPDPHHFVPVSKEMCVCFSGTKQTDGATNTSIKHPQYKKRNNYKNVEISKEKGFIISEN
jgi:hypothetical protein